MDIRDTTPAPAATNKLFDRSPAMRRKLVETMGGSKESEDAVARALAFLARTQEADGRWVAEVPTLPGVMTYGMTQVDAVARVQALALRVLAERLEHGEAVPELLSVTFQAA